MHESVGCACGCSCGNGIDRRQFLRLTGAETVALLASGLPAMAGPFVPADFRQLVPIDKRLHPDWVQSLFARGEPTVYRGEELKWIGMPIGGICAGQLYLGGDGRLWHWDIFNRHNETGPAHYAKPLTPSSPLQQGFVLTAGGRTRALDSTGFADISFRGEYPIGRVEYRAEDVAVTLEAFSPFIPLNTDDSSLPVTVMQFTVENRTGAPIDATLAGTLENVVARSAAGTPRNRIISGKGFTFLECSAEPSPVPEAPGRETAFETLPDNGTMGLALLGAPAEMAAAGALGRTLTLGAGERATVTFVIAWHFPNLAIKGVRDGGRFYRTRFDSALAAVRYVAENFDRLAAHTRLWRDTWYDSTLPYWFLDRTQLNTSILATSTCARFASGRFWAWEGVGCCAGTCGHVWQYAHAMARQFPELERIAREQVDFGLALQPDGAIHFRAESNNIPAIDAQAGTVLRAYREHQMSAGDAFLKRIWPGVRRATEWLIAKDGDGDGIIVSNQHNTLDTDWFGPVAWLSGLYIAALEAAAAMGGEMGDAAFAARCRGIAARGRTNIVERLFDGEYFANKPDPQHLDAINSGSGCEIDQVMGQSWAWQVGLPRVFPEKETRSALQSLWKYNFTPDVGPYRERYKAGRWYAMAGEAGLLMCTFPRAGWDYSQAAGKGPEWAAGYFNECMNGFEYQVAGHMIWEGMVLEGLAVTRAVHDRYHAARRNPWNEVECGDHYARSMASYGVYLAACGFEYHGPKAHIGFAPRLTPADFKAAFTSAEGWGSFSQSAHRAEIAVRFGQLRVRTVALAAPARPAAVRVSVAGEAVEATHAFASGRLTVTLKKESIVRAGQKLEVAIS